MEEEGGEAEFHQREWPRRRKRKENDSILERKPARRDQVVPYEKSFMTQVVQHVTTRSIHDLIHDHNTIIRHKRYLS